MHEVRSPFWSAGLDGTTTFSPGTCARHASYMSECWPPNPPPEPLIVRIVRGTPLSPPDMKRILAAWLTICYIATETKLIIMISATGRILATAAPTAAHTYHC